MNVWQMIECVLWVKPRLVLPESQDTQRARKKAFAKSQVPLEVNTSCSPLLAADNPVDVNVLCSIVGVSNLTGWDQAAPLTWISRANMWLMTMSLRVNS